MQTSDETTVGQRGTMRDREVGLGDAKPRTPAETRRIGEKLLLVDELEDTLAQVRVGGEPPERVSALERRLSAERGTLQAMEARGKLDYDEIARVMEAIDRSG